MIFTNSLLPAKAEIQGSNTPKSIMPGSDSRGQADSEKGVSYEIAL
jgi:hypothetical protein